MSNVRHMSDAWMAEHGLFLRRIAGAVLADESCAEDASQDAWLAALHSPPPRHLAAWLVTVTRRLASRSDREAVRRRRRERAVARDERMPAADSVAARAEIIRMVGEVVAELPEPFRETLLLRYWEGLAPRCISAQMGVPVATVQSRTRRGLRRVRTELERRAPHEQRWEESLALAAGLLRPSEIAEASTFTTTLGAVTMKTTNWIAGASALLALTAALAVGISALRPDAASGEQARPLPSLQDAAVRERKSVATAPTESAERRAALKASAAAPVGAPTLSVLVVDAKNRPVPGAELLGGAKAGDMRVVARTRDAGRARLELTPDLCLLSARAEGWAPSPVYELLPQGGFDELVLQLPLRGASLAVEVRDVGGALLPAARVFAGRGEELDYRLPGGAFARTAPGFAATTDALGIARFPGLMPGWLRVFVEHEEYAPATAFTTLELDRDNRLEIELQAGFDVAGRVCDEHGNPIAGARVERGSADRGVMSAADGSFHLGPIGAGKVTAVGPQGRRAEKRLRGDPGTVVRWNPVLPSEPAVRGRVVDELGRPQAGWWVHANFDTWPGWRKGARTDSEGRFAIFDPPSGALRVEVRVEEHASLPVLTREGIEAGSAEVLLAVPRNPWGRLTGEVERADTGTSAGLPLFLRHVTTPNRARLTGGPGRAIALDADGGFDLADVPGGSYELVLEGAPFGWHRLERFELVAGRTTDLGQLAIPEPGILRARSWWGGPEPKGDASYLLERRADMVSVLSFRGTFPDELKLAPGVYTLQTEVTPGPQREIEFEIQPGQVTAIELDLAVTCSHRVRVRYASGRAPVGRVSVYVRLLEEELQVFSGQATELEKDAWVVDVELGSGRFEFVARDAAGLEARVVENLYTSRPGREILVTLNDGEVSQ